MTRKMKVGVIGCGTMGLEHIGNLAANSRCGPENVFVFDQNADVMTTACDRFGVRSARSLDDLLRDAEIEAVVIACPNRFHAEMAIRALDEGKHVMLEKPMALNEEDARRVTAAAKASGKILHVGFELRNSLFPRKVKTMKEELGDLVSAQVVEYRGNFWPQWKGTTTDGGSMYMMETCHLIDIFRWWSESEVSEVHAVGSGKNIIPYYQYPDTQFTTLVFESGFVGHISLCHVRSAMPDDFSYSNPTASEEYLKEKYGHQYEYTVVGTKGSLYYLPIKGLLYRYRHEIQPDGSLWQRLDPSQDTKEFPDHKAGIHNSAVEIDEFLDAVLGNRIERLDPEDSLKTHLVCFAAEEALRSRRPVVMGAGGGLHPAPLTSPVKNWEIPSTAPRLLRTS